MKSILVTFVDVATGTCFARSEVPSDQLPTSFEARTTVNLEGQDWDIVQAEPMTRAEYERSGELRLTMQKIQISKMPPGEILFSLPTICDYIPGIAARTSKLNRKVLELHEDDWRQVELVSQANQAEMDGCLAQIRRIYMEARTDSGFFKKIHVRKEVARPLEGCQLAFNDLGKYFGSLVQLDGLAYRDVAGLIEGGFACESESGLCLYGSERLPP
jgi:hypothetical protein